MGLFSYTLLFPGGDADRCRAALEGGPWDADQDIRPEECSWHCFAKGPAVQLNEGAVGFDTAGMLSGEVAGPVMGLYIYDDDFWGYDLWQGGEALDRFASLPGYFDEDSPPDMPGDAGIVARCFGVEPERICRYLIPWPRLGEGSYAYDGDGAAVGDSWQMADFLDALGFDYDLLCPPPEPKKEPNRSVPTKADIPENTAGPGPRAKGRRAVDTPILPDALTDRPYALERAEALAAGYEEILCLLQGGKYQDLAARLTDAVRAAPEEAGLSLLRAFCWKMLEGLSTRSRVPDMLRDLTRALELEPENVMALRGRSSLTTTSRRYPQQIGDLTDLIRLDPENRDLYQVSRAYFHHWMKDDDAARADLREVLDRGELWTVDLVYLCGELGLPGV